MRVFRLKKVNIGIRRHFTRVNVGLKVLRCRISIKRGKRGRFCLLGQCALCRRNVQGSQCRRLCRIRSGTCSHRSISIRLSCRHNSLLCSNRRLRPSLTRQRRCQHVLSCRQISLRRNNIRRSDRQRGFSGVNLKLRRVKKCLKCCLGISNRFAGITGGLLGHHDLTHDGQLCRPRDPQRGQSPRNRRRVVQRLIRHKVRDDARLGIVDRSCRLIIAGRGTVARIGLGCIVDRRQQAGHHLIRCTEPFHARLEVVKAAIHSAQTIGDQRACHQL